MGTDGWGRQSLAAQTLPGSTLICPETVTGRGQAFCFQSRSYQLCCENGAADGCLVPIVKVVHTMEFCLCVPQKAGQGRSSSTQLQLVLPKHRQALSCLSSYLCVCSGGGLEKCMWRGTHLYAVGRWWVNL